MFVLILSLVACIGRAQVHLDLKALAKFKIKLSGLHVEEGSKQRKTYTFEPDAWIVINGFGPDLDGGISTHQYQFVEQDANSGNLLFQGHEKEKEPLEITIDRFQKMVQKFQVLVPVTPVPEPKKGEMLSSNAVLNEPGQLTIGEIESPWDGKRTFTAFDPKARGIFLITNDGVASGKMYEFFGIGPSPKRKLVFLEARRKDLPLKDEGGQDLPLKAREVRICVGARFWELISEGKVAVPVQNVRKIDYSVNYMSASRQLHEHFGRLHEPLSPGHFGIEPVNGNSHFGHFGNSQARAREDADYYRYGGYAYDGEREQDVAYDYYEDEEEDEEYNAFGQGFEAGYRAALEIVMNK